jgi:hypothetical protein
MNTIQSVEVTVRWHNIWLGCTVFFMLTTILFAGLFGGFYTAWDARPPCNENAHWIYGTGPEFDNACHVVGDDGLYAISGATCPSECDSWWYKQHPSYSFQSRRLSSPVTGQTRAMTSVTSRTNEECPPPPPPRPPCSPVSPDGSVTGCTDRTASNYCSTASYDPVPTLCRDGKVGCMDSTACNYNPYATTEYRSPACVGGTGCADSTATNYNSNVRYIDENSCIYEGCTDSTAVNYNSRNTGSNNVEWCQYRSNPTDKLTYCGPGDDSSIQTCDGTWTLEYTPAGCKCTLNNNIYTSIGNCRSNFKHMNLTNFCNWYDYNPTPTGRWEFGWNCGTGDPPCSTCRGLLSNDQCNARTNYQYPSFISCRGGPHNDNEYIGSSGIPDGFADSAFQFAPMKMGSKLLIMNMCQ